METTLIFTLLLAPFIGFLLNALWGKKWSNTTAGVIGTTAVAITFFTTIYLFLHQKETPINVTLLQWIQLEQFSINLDVLLDPLSLLWLLFVTGIGTLIHLYSVSYMHDDAHANKFFSYLNLFLFFMIILVIGSNLLVMFIGWEGVGLCSYLLIGFWHQNQSYNDAAKKAFIMNRIGDLGFLIGIFIIGYMFNSLDFLAIKSSVLAGNAIANNGLVALACICLFIGASGKSAQLPLYTWLPDAMAGPTPVSALIHAATMVTAGIFMITRLNFLFDLAPQVQELIAIVGAATAIVAAGIALYQNDIKKILAYSTVSQLGLMFVALGFGAYEIAVFHVITHAFFKACLFLGSGSVIHAMHNEQDITKMGGLRTKMKLTFATFLVAALAISGVPPLAGFFSKDEILMVAFHENKAIWIVASLASVLTAFYMFRLVFLTFFGTFRGSKEQEEKVHESPVAMTFPLVVLGILSAVGGAISLPGNSWLHHYLAPIFIKERATHHLDQTAYMLMLLAVVGAVIGILIAYQLFIKNKNVPANEATLTGFAKWSSQRFYVDEFYTAIVVNPVYKLGALSKNYTEKGIHALVVGIGSLFMEVSLVGKKGQNGNIGFYLFAFAFGLCAVVFYLFFIR